MELITALIFLVLVCSKVQITDVRTNVYELDGKNLSLISIGAVTADSPRNDEVNTLYIDTDITHYKYPDFLKEQFKVTLLSKYYNVRATVPFKDLVDIFTQLNDNESAFKVNVMIIGQDYNKSGIQSNQDGFYGLVKQFSQMKDSILKVRSEYEKEHHDVDNLSLGVANLIIQERLFPLIGSPHNHQNVKKKEVLLTFLKEKTKEFNIGMLAMETLANAVETNSPTDSVVVAIKIIKYFKQDADKLVEKKLAEMIIPTKKLLRRKA
jgi:hypothetical protein